MRYSVLVIGAAGFGLDPGRARLSFSAGSCSWGIIVYQLRKVEAGFGLEPRRCSVILLGGQILLSLDVLVIALSFVAIAAALVVAHGLFSRHVLLSHAAG